MGLMALLLWTVVAVGSIVFCHMVAKRRGANPVFWGVMAVIFGPLAIPFVFLSKKKKP